MPCKEIKSWTFNELVGAFVDLAITYLLLCASSLAFLAEKFLGLFGLCLPCPCNGLFGDPNRNKCWQRVLVDCPSKHVSSVQFSVKSRFPFDSIWDKESTSELSTGIINEGHCATETVASEDEASCSSFRERKNGIGVESSVVYTRDAKEQRFDMKRMEVSGHEGRYIRHRRKSAADKGRLSSVSSHDCFQPEAQVHPLSPASVNKIVHKCYKGNRVPPSSGEDTLHVEDSKESSKDFGLVRTVFCGFESNETVDEKMPTEKDASPGDDLIINARGESCFGRDGKGTIRVFEQALEEEHAARAALYLELEKERSAAATAADEAMAMILRLQEEKASIEMEARQYQRMIEEKSAYDFEEMNIIKEILLRREKEKHFLEKEVETYRQMIFGNEQKASSSLNFGENPLMMLQIGESIDEENRDKSNKLLGSEVQSAEPESCTLAFGKELSIPELDEVDSLERGCISRHPSIDIHRHRLSSDREEISVVFQEKEQLSLDWIPFDQEIEAQSTESHSQFNLSTQDCNLQEKSFSTTLQVLQQSDGISVGQALASKTTKTFHHSKTIFPNNCDDSEKHELDSRDAAFDLGPHVHDVHVIDDKIDVSSETNKNGSEKLSMAAVLDSPRTCDSPSMSEAEQDSCKSCSDVTNRLPSVGSSRSKSLLSDLRRNSMSAVDYERFKIDSEVGWLRERLRIIQEGREKLNISMESREKEKTQLQLLENIISQLREFRQSTEHEKAVRQASLPPLSCKVMSKKRHWRSVSLGMRRST